MVQGVSQLVDEFYQAEDHKCGDQEIDDRCDKIITLPGTHFFCDTRAAAGPVSEDFFERENVHCANVSAGRTKQAFVLLSQKVLANLRTALGE